MNVKATQSVERDHMPQLDGLRTVSVAGVFVAHVVPNWDIAGFGFGGVRIFFVLSGFLITRILLGCREKSPGFAVRQFYARRFLRIFPLYYVTIALLWIAFREFRPDFFWYATYLSNFRIAMTGHWLGAAGHFWTLAVEEQFYLVWPWVVLFLPRRALTPTFFLAFAIGPLFRIAAVHSGMTVLQVEEFTPACLDTLGAGAILALAHQGWIRWPRWLDYLLLVLGLVLWIACFTVMTQSMRLVFQNTAMGFLGVSLVSFGSRNQLWAWLASKPMVELGRISYGLYVLHLPVMSVVSHVLWRIEKIPHLPTLAFDIVSLCLVVGATIVVARVSWLGLEQPLNNLKRYFPYSRPKVVY